MSLLDTLSSEFPALSSDWMMLTDVLSFSNSTRFQFEILAANTVRRNFKQSEINTCEMVLKTCLRKQQQSKSF